MRRSRPKSQRQYVLQNDAAIIAAKLPGAKTAKHPAFVPPALATLRDKVPTGAKWIHDVILDGEVIVPTATGHSDFGALVKDLAASRSDRFIYYAFDVLHIHGYDLRRCALTDRKRVLEELLRGEKGPIQFSEHLPEGGEKLFRRACDMDLEGIVSKRVDTPYRSGRTADWTKRTCRQRETFIIAGLAYKNKKFDGVYLARRDEDDLLYAGKVENGFDDATVKDIERRAKKLVTRKQPLTRKIAKPKATWLKPELLADVEFRALTGDGKLRHPSFKGLREDLH